MNKLNKRIINDRYKDFIPTEDKQLEAFKSNLKALKPKLDVILTKEVKPLLIYTRNSRNEIYYLLSIHYSFLKGKVLNYTAISGQTFTRQHFADSEKDRELHDKTYHDEILFISLSEIDYTSEYMENLIMDLIDYRTQNKKATIVTFDTQTGNRGRAAKLEIHFRNKHYSITDLANTPGVATTHYATKTKTNKTGNKPKGAGMLTDGEGRII